MSPSAIAGDMSCRIQTFGYGPVKINMTPQEASEALGASFSKSSSPESEDCYYLNLEGDSSPWGTWCKTSRLFAKLYVP